MRGMVASKSVEFARDAFPNAGNEAPLFDHLVGAHQHRLRNREAERLGCVEVYQERNNGNHDARVSRHVIRSRDGR